MKPMILGHANWRPVQTKHVYQEVHTGLWQSQILNQRQERPTKTNKLHLHSRSKDPCASNPGWVGPRLRKQAHCKERCQKMAPSGTNPMALNKWVEVMLGRWFPPRYDGYIMPNSHPTETVEWAKDEAELANDLAREARPPASLKGEFPFLRRGS